MGRTKVAPSDFYCLNCGNRYSLFRKQGKQKSSFHRERLYCFHCKCECNFIECRNLKDVEEFKKHFQAGDYKEEAKESIEYCKMESGII